MLGKELTLLDPKTGLEVKAEDLIEQVAREINNGGLPEKLSVIIPEEQNLPTQFSGKYTLASKKWPPKNGRECWISDGQAPAAYRIFMTLISESGQLEEIFPVMKKTKFIVR